VLLPATARLMIAGGNQGMMGVANMMTAAVMTQIAR
jgi:hypothetical protein